MTYKINISLKYKNLIHFYIYFFCKILNKKMTKIINKIIILRFLVGMRDVSSSVEQQDATLIMREVASRYPQYNITTFMPLWLFTDQYAIIIPNTIQNIIIAMIVMVIIAILLIPQPSCALWVTLAIASIDVGVVGYMTMWGVNLVSFVKTIRNSLQIIIF